MDWSVRSMTAADLPEAVAIEAAVSPHPWSANQFDESFEAHHCFVLMAGQSVAGFLVYLQVGPEAEILNIAVNPDLQGLGGGTHLLNWLIHHLAGSGERLYLEVRVSNFTAIRLYQRVGFVELCVRENYYPTAHGREDAIMMAVELMAG